MKDKDFRKWYGSVSGIEANRKGVIRRRYASKSSYPERISYSKVRKDEEGNQYVIADSKRLRVDYIVAKCFCHNPMNDEFVIHRDGNKSNCEASNLQWVNAYVYNKMNGITDWGYSDAGFRVSKSGEVQLDGKQETISCYSYDSDTYTDTTYSTTPYVANGMFNQYHFQVDELVAAAWLKYPDQTDGILNPALLHIDGDYKNCSADNLKWVERGCQEYKDFVHRRSIDLAAEEEKLKREKP